MDHSTYQALKLSLLLFVIALKAFLIFYLCYLANRLRLSANAAAPKRLNPSVLKEIPVLVYSAQTHDATLECAVCLSEFQDGEEARVLPACKHTFHSACVGAWLRSHSDCPLCRAPVREICPAAGNVQRAELRREGDSGRLGSAPSYSPPARLAPLQCERIMPDLVGITVEVTVSSGVSGSAH